MLTNVFTRLTFYQYGQPYVMEYYGNKTSAIRALKLMYGAKPSCIFEGVRDGFYPANNYSTF